MGHRIRKHLSYANVTATLALIVALGGTSYAAITLPANSVGPRQLRAGAVTSRAIRPGSVGARQVHAYSLTGRNIDKRRLGRVPAAVNAITASTAAHARDADTLGGLSAAALRVHCPSGTLLNAAGCVETSLRAGASYGNAAGQCADRRLPTAADLESFRERFSAQAGTAIELTSDLADADNVITVNMATGATGTSSAGSSLPFRCVAAPSN